MTSRNWKPRMQKRLRPTKFVALIACSLAALVTLHELAYAVFSETVTADILSVRTESRREVVTDRSHPRRTKAVTRKHAILTYRFRDRHGFEYEGELEPTRVSPNSTKIEIEYIPMLGAYRSKSPSDPIIDIFLLWCATAAVIGMTWCFFGIAHRITNRRS